VISVIANALPAKLSRMIRFAGNEQYREARELHLLLIDMLKLIFREGSPGGVKALMEILGKAQHVMRLPMYPVSQELYHDIEAELKKIL
jgi:4-hydroxy-tetrahydrodipicolinate synthase